MTLAVAVVLGLACSGCPPETTAPPPRGAAVSEVPDAEAPPSVLVIEALLTPAWLRAMVQSALPTTLHKEDARPVVADVVADIVAARGEEVRVLLREDTLRFDVPVDVKADVYRKKRDGSRGSTLGRGRAELLLQISMGLRIRNDWTFVPTTEVSYRWSSSPTLRVGSIKLDLGDMLDRRLEAGLPALKEGINEKVRSATALREQAEQIWTTLHVPRRLQKQPPLWLRFSPDHLFASDPTVSGRGMALTLGTEGGVTLSTERTRVDAAPLPERARPPAETPRTHLRVPLEVGWPVLQRQASEQLVGQTLSAPLPAGAGEAVAEVTEVIDVYPSGTSLAVGLRLVGAVEATGTALQAEVWLLGRPILDPATQVLRLEDFTYTAATDSRAANLALEALRERIQAAAAEHLTFPLEDALAPVRAELGAQLAQIPLDGGAVLSGEVVGLQLQAVHLRDEALVVEADLDAALHILVDVVPAEPATP